MKDSENFIIYSFKRAKNDFLGYYWTVDKNKNGETAIDIMRKCVFMDIDSDGCDELIVYSQSDPKSLSGAVVSYVKYTPEGNNLKKELFDYSSYLATLKAPDYKENKEVNFQIVPNKTLVRNDLYLVMSDASYGIIDFENKRISPRYRFNGGNILWDTKLYDSHIIDVFSDGNPQLLWRDKDDKWRIGDLKSTQILKQFDSEYTSASIIDANQDGQQDILFFTRRGNGVLYENNLGEFISRGTNLTMHSFINRPSGIDIEFLQKYQFSSSICQVDTDLDGKSEYFIHYLLEPKKGESEFHSGVQHFKYENGTWTRINIFRQKKDASIDVHFGRFVSDNSIDIYYKEIVNNEKEQGYTLITWENYPPSTKSSSPEWRKNCRIQLS